MNRVVNRFTPQDKNLAVNAKFGNTGIKNQQGTSVLKYDTLPIDGRTTFNFFEGASSRNFPFSNCGSDGNKLGVGNTLVVERIYLTVLLKNEQGNYFPLDESILTLPAIMVGELNFNIANSTVLKNFPILSTVAEFNYSALSNSDQVYELSTNIVIPPLLEYIAQLRVAKYTYGNPNLHLRLTIEGSGSIIAPRTTF